MKIFSLLVILFMLTTLANAQEKPANKFNFGIRGAFNESYISNVSTYPQTYFPFPTTESQAGFYPYSATSRRNSAGYAGFAAGIFVELQMANQLAFRPELNYSVKGAYNFQSRYRDRYDYISLPLLIKWKISRKLSFFAGPEINYLLDAKRTYSDSSVYHQNYFIPVTTIKPALNKWDIDIDAGLEYALTSRIGIDLRYSYGLTYINKLRPYNSMNRTLQLGISYKFR